MALVGNIANRLVVKNSINKTFVRNFEATPPRVRISFPEKVTHGIVMALGFVAVPAYISVNIKNYRGPVEGR